MHRLAVVSLFVAMVLSGCHPFVLLPESEVMVEVKGRYIHEFEVQCFKPQGSLDDWWLTWNDAFREQWDATTDGYCVPVWVHVKGKKSGQVSKGTKADTCMNYRSPRSLKCGFPKEPRLRIRHV